MEPTSVWLIVLPVTAAVALLVVMCRWTNLVLRLFAGLFALVLATGTGVALVNDYYGYYQTWSALGSDFSGSTPDIGSPGPAGPPTTTAVATGRLDRVVIRGAGISRTAYVYLPPGYGATGVDLPVVELFHGSPGRPTDYLHLHLLQDLDTAIAEHHIGPMVLVLPAINPSSGFEDCVNGPKGQDATYLTQVVPAYVRAHFAVEPDPGQWGLAGYSSGGYCAANLGSATGRLHRRGRGHGRLLPRPGRPGRRGAGLQPATARRQRPTGRGRPAASRHPRAPDLGGGRDRRQR